jgi:hypothetical protein
MTRPGGNRASMATWVRAAAAGGSDLAGEQEVEASSICAAARVGGQQQVLEEVEVVWRR